MRLDLKKLRKRGYHIILNEAADTLEIYSTGQVIPDELVDTLRERYGLNKFAAYEAIELIAARKMQADMEACAD